ncbi:suppressor APC domain-containing protein 2 [Plutella xylostella]|uniref:suppressor APC domain-containing protein 2 n=1 Tax=Plutella xylostella TaxID=51655 RepID=UPI002032194A|nr:suppressor APC domain-containing protein 2 [Plutella xylostella]
MESLPKQFVSAMRTLFDIMDDKRTGYVRLTDIENRWRDDRTKGLPRGVLESLQKVASHDGFLTFDRFCTGLKICLLRNQVETQTSHKIDSINADMEKTVTNSKLSMQSHRPPSAPILDIDDSHHRQRNWNELKISDNINQHRTISMPLLIVRKDAQGKDVHQDMMCPPQKPADTVYGSGPPKPPRLDKTAMEKRELSRTSFKSEEESYKIEHLCKNEEDILRGVVDGQSRGHGDGRPNPESSQAARRPRRREPRRHTLHNGVDYNLLKRMKQIEQEKDILLQGLSSIEEAREWYLKQLAEVQEKMRYAGRMGAYLEPWTEAQQERLELLRARVLEVNRQLGALAAGWRRGPLSLHMNLALPTPRTTPAPPVHSQNRMLLEEVNKKNERISILEREKSSLIRELLLQRNRSKIMDNLN